MKLLNSKQVAEALGVHPTTVARWLNANRLPYVTVNGRRYIKQSSLDRLGE